jgi:hypothetical protein
VGASSDETEPVQRIRLVLPYETHIYDTRKGIYHGFASCVETEIAAGDALIFALLDKKIEEIKIDAPQSVKTGADFNIQFEAITGEGKNPASSVMAVTFTTPSGKYAWEYSENIACAGSASIGRRLPFNAEKGLWAVTVKDAASGVSHTVKVNVSAME